MRIVLISEHFDPVLGGTTAYVKSISRHLFKFDDGNIQAVLVVPGVQKEDSWEKEHDRFSILRIGTGINFQKSFPRQTRYQFCQRVNEFLYRYTEENKVDVIHVLFGLFLTETLDTKIFKGKGIRLVNTIHNVPPQECSISWPGDDKINFWKDELRKKAVRQINKKRLQNSSFDAYITPSKIVKNLLSDYIPSDKIHVINHGSNYVPKSGDTQSGSAKNGKIRVLTVGGFVPHKRQHICIETARKMKDLKMDFHWDLVGPSRNKKYVAFLQRKIQDLDLVDKVSIHISIPRKDLDNLFSNSNLYIQPSTEEGFCLTALEAAVRGIPVIGSPAGAIPEIIGRTKGLVTESNAIELTNAIRHFTKIRESFEVPETTVKDLVSFYSWESSIKKLLTLYNG